MKSLVGLVCMVAAGIGVVTPMSAPAPVNTPADQVQKCDITVYKLGSLQLPYVGEGNIEYNAVSNSWIIGVKAPEGFNCSNVGWEFPAEGDSPVAPPPGEDAWFISGALDIQVVGDMLVIVATTLTGVHEFYFAYTPDMDWQSGKTFVQNDFGDVEIQIDAQQQQQLQQAVECPGGSCTCTGKCTACCSQGYHPHCNCSGAGSCNCLENPQPKPKKAVLSPISYQEVNYAQ